MSFSLEYFEERRRNAYVDALMMKDDGVLVGTLGPVPWEILYAGGFLAVPLYGIDKEIIRYSEREDLCPLIRATAAYAKTDKCPFIHSVEFFVADDSCPLRNEVLEGVLPNPLYIVRSKEELLKLTEERSGHRIFKNRLEEAVKLSKEISRQIRRIRHSDYGLRDAYAIEYGSKFILDPKRRLELLKEVPGRGNRPKKEIRIQAGGNIYRRVDDRKDAVLIEGIFCEGENHLPPFAEKYMKKTGSPDLVLKNCPYYEGTTTDYIYKEEMI